MSRSQATQPPLCMPLAHWPMADRTAWETACDADPWEADGRAATLRPDTLFKYVRGVGRWLSFLTGAGLLDPEQLPSSRITRDRIKLYIQELKARQNAPATIAGRLMELHHAMRLMAPDSDLDWLLAPYGAPIRNLVGAKIHVRPVLGADELYRWACEIMDHAVAQSPRGLQATAFRNGLLLAMLAACGRRRRAVGLLEVRHLVRRADHFWIELPAELNKTRKPDTFLLPASLTPYLRTYLEQVRPQLLTARPHAWFWVNTRGGPWTEKAIGHQVAKSTRAQFGLAYSPHDFRRSVATTAALNARANLNLPAEVLGITGAVANKHYNLAGCAQAAADLADIIEGRRPRRR